MMSNQRNMSFPVQLGQEPDEVGKTSVSMFNAAAVPLIIPTVQIREMEYMIRNIYDIIDLV